MRSATVTAVIVGLACGLSAFGDPIAIFSTGVDSSGSPLTPGTVDSHYALVSAPSGVTLTAIATSPNGAWTPNTSTADWISPGSSGGTSFPPGTYDYQTTFDLTGLDPTTAQLSGKWTSDNNGWIDLNGVMTGVTSAFAGFGSLSSFSITSGFQPGLNTLDFVIVNGSDSFSPTGVIADISGTATASSSVSGPSAVPEPSSLSMFILGGGLLGLGGLGRKLARSRN